MTATPLPCLVLGIETQIGLGVVRELGRAGIPVIGIALRASALGLASRYLVRRVVLANGLDDAAIDTIRALGEEFGGGVLMGISEPTLAWMIANQDRFGRVRAAVPPAEAFRIVLDKEKTLAHAAELGIPVPRSVQPRNLEEALAAGDGLHFPVVVKWADPAAVASRLSAHGLPLHKYEYAYDAPTLAAILRRYAPVEAFPLVQEYAPGQGLGQFFLIHDGQALRRFQHVRVAEWPPEGGFSSVCDSLPLEAHAALQEQSIALLQRIGWRGVAMVEYRFDPATGRAVLMEINGRFWGSFPLAVQAGAGFALLAYWLAATGQAPVLPPPRPAQRCRMLSTELKRLVRILLQPGRIQDRQVRIRPVRELLRFATDFFRPGVGYYVMALDDPAPLLRDIRNILTRR